MMNQSYTSFEELPVMLTIPQVAKVLDRMGRSKEDKELLAQIENRLAALARLGRAFGYPSDPRHPAPGRQYSPRPDQEQPGFPGLRQGGHYTVTNHLGQQQRRRPDTQRREGPVHHRGRHRVPGLPVRPGAAIRLGAALLWQGNGKSTTTAREYPSMRWTHWPVSYFRRYKRFLRARKDSGSLPSGRHSRNRTK